MLSIDHRHAMLHYSFFFFCICDILRPIRARQLYDCVECVKKQRIRPAFLLHEFFSSSHSTCLSGIKR